LWYDYFPLGSDNNALQAEVQQFFADGGVSLHTRSLRCCKLRNGTLITVPPTLIKRSQTQFITISPGVEVILGMNGMIWVCQSLSSAESVQDDDEKLAQTFYSNRNDVRMLVQRLVLIM
jgi:exosome complex component RRP4